MRRHYMPGWPETQEALPWPCSESSGLMLWSAGAAYKLNVAADCCDDTGVPLSADAC